ncbi:hypothetical protein SASPL_132384 [Salvia splendens]|uniref:Uncharacterized protein n=1 Tax=Salvia splendens TaxID=180675 RepID=A0A8X8X341_SALSN|nr:hypothetical protein SASPL_132384 [Salvia splendens]
MAKPCPNIRELEIEKIHTRHSSFHLFTVFEVREQIQDEFDETIFQGRVNVRAAFTKLKPCTLSLETPLSTKMHDVIVIGETVLRLAKVSDIICEMGSLRYLYMSDVMYRAPLKVDALQNLITLTYVSIYDWTCKLFASLAIIKCLGHPILRGFRFRSMSCLDEISALYTVSTLRIDGLISRLPSANKFPTWIKNLALVNTCLDEDPYQY